MGVCVYIPKNDYDIEFQRTICKYICKKANKTLMSKMNVLCCLQDKEQATRERLADAQRKKAIMLKERENKVP